MQKIEIFYFYLLLLVIIFFGLYLRFDDITFWEKNKKLFFYEEIPIYSEYDSYYFARIAQDIKEKKFKTGSIDNYRFFPDNSSKAIFDKNNKFYSEYKISGHLISLIWAYISKFFGISLEKITWYLIPILAILMVFPIFWYCKDLGYPYAGLIGALVGISAPLYLARTNLMRLDHDCLNLFFPFLIAYIFFKFFQTSSSKFKYLWISLASILLILYYLWYAHSNLNFVLVSMFIIGYFWNKKLNWKKEDLIFIFLLIIPQVWYVYSGPYHLYQQVKTLVFNIKSPTSVEILFKDFPNIFMSISELQKLSFKEVITNTILNYPLGILGLIGGILCFVLNFKNMLFILPFFGIGMLSFFSGARFIMYLAPFIGIGVGFLVSLFLNKFKLYLGLFKEEQKRNLIVHFFGTLILFLIIFIQKDVLKINSYPKVFSSLVKDMDYLKNLTPSGSVVWTWWDYGYAFQLYSRRATFHDGGSQGTPKTYFVARTFTTSDPKEAWNIISFIANYGLIGIAEKLKNGVPAQELFEKVKSGEYFKNLNTPIYWVFTEDLVSKFAWIHYFGSYNFEKKEGKFGPIITPTYCEIVTRNVLDCKDINIIIDLNNGLLTTPARSIPISLFYLKTPEKVFQKNFFENGYVVEIVKTKYTGRVFIFEPSIFETLFNQMYILRKYDPRYFELVLDDFPHAVVYKVKEK